MRLPVLFAAAALLSTAFAAHADTITQLTSANQLSSTDVQNPIVSANHPIGYVSPGPSISFTGASQETFSRGSGQFKIDQAGYTYGDTAFANGTDLVGAGGFQGPGNGGPITLTFSTPVVQFGLNTEEFNGGLYNVSFLVFSSTGSLLGTFMASGNDPISGGSGQLSFEGVTVTGTSIGSVQFSDLPTGSNDLLFGNIEYNTNPANLQTPAVTPEPSSLVLLGTGLLSLASLARKRFAQSRAQTRRLWLRPEPLRHSRPLQSFGASLLVASPSTFTHFASHPGSFIGKDNATCKVKRLRARLR